MTARIGWPAAARRGTLVSMPSDYERIARVIRFLDESHADQPDLAALADHAGLSPFHFHRMFSAWAGVTPKDFLQCLTMTHAKRLLRAGATVLDASLECGLSGPGRLHDLSVSLEAAAPGELKSGGAGWTIAAGFAASPFGICLIAENPRGICGLSFPDSRDDGWTELEASWPNARLERDDARAARLADTIFTAAGDQPSGRPAPLRVFVRGTPFQVKVWRALLRIGPGSVVSYGRLASAVSARGAARAVGSAVGRNPIAVLIPCHRVIRESGALGGYRWGLDRKRAILAWESARRGPVTAAETASAPPAAPAEGQ